MKNKEIKGEAIVKSKKAITLSILKTYSIITFGCLIYSLGISLFIEPAELTAGGMTGIALMIYKLTGFSTGYLVIILNIPMFILGLIFFGWKFVVSTGYATVFSGLLMRLWSFIFGEKVLDVLKYLTCSQQNSTSLITNCVVGATLFALGMGIIFRMGASTAGTDVIIKLLRRKFRHIKTGTISMVTDLIIVGCSFFINYDIGIAARVDNLFYSVLVVVIFSFVFNRALYSGDSAQMVFIITCKEKAQQICTRILKEIDSGATCINGEGAYTGEEKKIIFCVLKPNVYPHLRDVVAQEDKSAFMVVASANEIFGEHYKDQNAEEL